MAEGPAANGRHAPGQRRAGTLRRLAKEFRRNPVFALATLLAIGFVVVAVFADALAPYPHDRLDLRNRTQPPSLETGFVLGTDELGRDVLSQMVYGIRTSLGIAGSAVLLAAFVGSLLGAFAGLFGGPYDALLMRLVDMQLAIPAFFLALAGAVILGRGIGPMMVVLALVSWAHFARVGRASALSAREEPFVEAARGLGAGHARIAMRHVLPNIAAPLMVVFSISLPHTIMVEASLSFVGMGLPATVPSLGSMINRGYVQLLAGSWWISILPGLALMVLVLSINTITDALRDVLDVKLK